MRRLTALTFVLVTLVATPAIAQIYRWVDDHGVPHYADGLDSVPERFRAASTPVGLRNTRPASEPAPARPTPALGTTIRYAPGRPIVADVRINGATSVRLMLDTGADRTLISPRTLAAAGVSLTRPIGTGRIVGVTGSDQMPYVFVDSLEVAGLRVGRMAVGAYDVAGLDGDGLLGRDVLDQFTVAIDAAQGLVTLSPK